MLRFGVFQLYLNLILKTSLSTRITSFESFRFTLQSIYRWYRKHPRNGSKSTIPGSSLRRTCQLTVIYPAVAKLAWDICKRWLMIVRNRWICRPPLSPRVLLTGSSLVHSNPLSDQTRLYSISQDPSLFVGDRSWTANNATIIVIYVDRYPSLTRRKSCPSTETCTPPISFILRGGKSFSCFSVPSNCSTRDIATVYPTFYIG